MSTKTLFRAIAANAAEEEFMIMAAHEYYSLSDSHSWRGIKPSRGLLRNKWPVEVHAEKGGYIEIRADLSEETIASTQSMQQFVESDLYQELRSRKHKTTKSLEAALGHRNRKHRGPRNLAQQFNKKAQEDVLDTEAPESQNSGEIAFAVAVDAPAEKNFVIELAKIYHKSQGRTEREYPFIQSPVNPGEQEFVAADKNGYILIGGRIVCGITEPHKLSGFLFTNKYREMLRNSKEYRGPRNLVEQLYKNTQEAVLEEEPKDPRFCHCPCKGHYCECGQPEAPEGADEPGFNPKCEVCTLPLYGTAITAKCQCSKTKPREPFPYTPQDATTLPPHVMFAQNLLMEAENQQTVGAWFKKKAAALMGVSEKAEPGPEPAQKTKDYIAEVVAKQTPITFPRLAGFTSSVPRRLIFLVTSNDVKKVMGENPEISESLNLAVTTHGEDMAREYFHNIQKGIQKAIDRGDDQVTLTYGIDPLLPSNVTYNLSFLKKSTSLETLEKRYMLIGKSEMKARRFMDIARYFGHRFHYLQIQNIDFFVPDHAMSCKYICVKNGDILFTYEDVLISGLEEVSYSEVLCAINQARLDNADD